MDIIKRIKEEKVVGVIRANDESETIDIVKACIAGNLKIVEITYTIPNAGTVIKNMTDMFGQEVIIGAGTVINKTMCKEAIVAGATFIVSPGFDLKVAKYCRRKKIPYIPGCITPTEMLYAINHGAQIIKLFPGNLFDPSYIKTLKGPFPNIEIMPTGGVNIDNAKTWLEFGACAIGVGSELTKPAKTKDFERITEIAKSYADLAKE